MIEKPETLDDTKRERVFITAEKPNGGYIAWVRGRGDLWANGENRAEAVAHAADSLMSAEPPPRLNRLYEKKEAQE